MTLHKSRGGDPPSQKTVLGVSALHKKGCRDPSGVAGTPRNGVEGGSCPPQEGCGPPPITAPSPRKSRTITGSSSWPSVASSRKGGEGASIWRGIRGSAFAPPDPPFTPPKPPQEDSRPPSIRSCSSWSRHRRVTKAEPDVFGAGSPRTPPFLFYFGVGESPHIPLWGDPPAAPPRAVCFVFIHLLRFYMNLYGGYFRLFLWRG